MTLHYALTDPPSADPDGPQPTTYLNILTDDTGLIQQMTIPKYRASDATTQRLLDDWETYAVASGSPPTDQTILQFKEYIEATYAATYAVVQIGISAA